MEKRPRKTRRKNQSPAGGETHAVKLFRSFHGRDSQQMLDRQSWAAQEGTYTVIGDLEKIKLESPDGHKGEITFDGDGVKLASSPDGHQLYLIGGNQNLNGQLERLVEDPAKDLHDLGEAVEVTYVARKVHANFEPVSWYHKFGEKGGERPRLGYYKPKRELFFLGGEYFIDTAAKISPGIEN